MTLGDKIKQLRSKPGREMTQKDLAEKIGIEVTYLSKIENNRLPHYLSEGKLKKIADVFSLNREEEEELFKLAKKIASSTKELVQRKPVLQFLREISLDWDDNEIEKFIKRKTKAPKK